MQALGVLFAILIEFFRDVAQLPRHFLGCIVYGPVDLHVKVRHGVTVSSLDRGIPLDEKGIVHRQHVKEEMNKTGVVKVA